MAVRDPRRDPRMEAGFTLGDMARIFRRRIRWFWIPMVLGMVVALAVALGLPPTYEASTTILIEPPGIPKEIVQTTVVQDKETRFENIRLQILSRDNLSDLIDRFKLDPDDGTPREDVVAEMRDAIEIAPILPEIVDPRRKLEINSMKITYRSSNPDMAAGVANALARDFIRENLEQRSADAEGTSVFINAELSRQQRKLEQISDKIQEFKEEHLGSLPEQLETSRRTLEKLYLEMNDKKGDLDFAQNQVNMLQARQTQQRTAPTGDDEDDPTVHKQELLMQLSQAKALGMTERHPTIKRVRREIADMDRMIAARATAKAEDDEPPVRSDAEERLDNELRAWQVKTVVGSQEVARLGDEIGKYEARIENTPRVAAELGGLEDRRKAVQIGIAGLESKAHAADIARSLEVKQKGEKFRVIEQAEAPESPVSPNRPLFFAIGTLLGLFSGLALVAIREVTDERVYTLGELTEAINLPILGSVPRIRLAAEIAEARRRFRRFALTTAGAGAILLAGAVATWYLTQAGDESLTPAPAAATQDSAGDV